MADESKQPQPTASEAMFFFSIVKNMKTQADIDWVNVAEDRGFKNAEVAKVRFGQVKRKLGIWSDNGGAKSSPKKTKTPLSTPTKVTKTPTKRGAAKARMSKMKKEDDYDDEDNKEDASKNESDTDGGSVAKQEETDAGLNDPF
ncbi:hypothetical protein V2G26_016156 [Clonostachys chloroleuca]|uniref:Uncharacterized protein n=2 Tax=Bionectria ochroleuca TaxID=29856 RepID=A0A0B7JYF9_BIOOC|nr:unnamed protein product [Clonostachys rosea f. rosea IK726]